MSYIACGFERKERYDSQPCEFPTAEVNWCGNCRGNLLGPQQKNAEGIFTSSIMINLPYVHWGLCVTENKVIALNLSLENKVGIYLQCT